MAKQREHLAWSRALQHLARSGALRSTAFNYWVIWSLARLVTVEAAQISNLTGRESSNLACHIVGGRGGGGCGVSGFIFKPGLTHNCSCQEGDGDIM